MRRRARRRRALWALIALLVIAGFVMLAWPPPPQHLYSQTVQIGQRSASAKSLTFDAADVTKPPAIEQVVAAVDASPNVAVEIHSTVSRRRVSDAADLVRSTMQVIAPARAEAEVTATDILARTQRQRLRDAERRISDWRAEKGYDDPTQHVTVLEAQLAHAASTHADAATVARVQAQLLDARSAVASYAALTAARDTANAAAQSASAAHARAVDALNALRTRATWRTVITPVSTQTADGPRPFWPVAAAVILQVIAIVAAEILVITRTRWVPEHERHRTRAERKPKPEPKREPKPRRQPRRQPQEQPQPVGRDDRLAPRHRARRRPRPRTTSGRVVAKPLDLPNLEVHFVGGQQDGRRAVELRDAPGGREDAPQAGPQH